MIGLTLESQVADLEALVRALLGRDYGGVADQRVVDTRVWNQVGLKLIQVDIESAIETKTRCNGTDNLGDETIEVLEVRSGDVQVAATDIVDSFIINKERAVGVLNGAVGGQDSIVGFDDRCGYARRRVNGEFELALLAVVCGQTLEQESSESRSGSATEGMEDEEALERGAIV